VSALKQERRATPACEPPFVLHVSKGGHSTVKLFVGGAWGVRSCPLPLGASFQQSRYSFYVKPAVFPVT
jgi:hypothetical protein